jgi:hypothetical protein
MKINRLQLLSLGFTLVGILAFISCRKIDRQLGEVTSVNPQSKFFTEHASNKPLVQAINQYFKRLNNMENFVEKTIKKIGYPRWDKAITVKFSGFLNRGASDSTELTYIPFVREEDGFVNASLLVQTSPTDTAFKYICDWQYQYEQNGLLEDTAVSAERIAFTLMTLDKEVFGHTKYKLTDSKLFENYFPDSLRGNQSYLEFGTQNGNRNSNRTESMSSSITFTIYCSSCISLYWQIIYYYNLNGIPTWEFTGGGGGGSSGNSTPPDCPGIPVSRGQNVTNPCSPGWIPVPPVPPPPLNDSTIAENLKRLIQKAYNKPDSVHNAAQQDSTERTFSFLRSRGDTTVMYIKPGTQHISSPTITSNTFAILHTHQEDDLTGGTDKNQCFDGPDIYKLYKNVGVDGYPIEVSIVTTRDYYYAAVITDPIKFRDYIRTLCGTQNLYRIDYLLNEFHVSAMDACVSQPTCNWQKKTELGVLAITANNNSSISGIKIFRSPKQNINFTLLTP